MDLLQPIDDIHFCNSIFVVIIVYSVCLSVVSFLGVKCRTCLIELLMVVRKILVGRAPAGNEGFKGYSCTQIYIVVVLEDLLLK